MSEKTQKMQEGIISESKLKFRKVKSDEEDSNIGEQVHFNIDKEVDEGSKPTLALLPI